MDKLRTFMSLNAGPIRFTVIVIALVLAGILIAKCNWGWLNTGGSTNSSNGDTLRTVGLLIGGVVALVFGLWRAWIAERQADAAQGQTAASIEQVNAAQAQVEAAQRQAETAQQSLLNERYQRGAEMLSSGVLTARLGGIYSLQLLAEEYAEQYQVQILRLFCAFVRDPDGDAETRTRRSVTPAEVVPHSLRQDVQAAVEGISSILARGTLSENGSDTYIDLRGSRLNGIYLEGGDLSGADLRYAELVRADLENTYLWGAKLQRTQLQASNLRGTVLTRATMFRTDLAGADLSNATLDGANVLEANLDGALFHEASLARTVFSDTQVRQSQLNQTRVNPHNPPRFLNNAVDPQTGRPLDFHGEPLSNT